MKLSVPALSDLTNYDWWVLQLLKAERSYLFVVLSCIKIKVSHFGYTDIMDGGRNKSVTELDSSVVKGYQDTVCTYCTLVFEAAPTKSVII